MRNEALETMLDDVRVSATNRVYSRVKIYYAHKDSSKNDSECATMG